MAQSIVQGLFGPAPWEIQQAQAQEQQAQAERFANMNATQRGVMGMNRAGQQLGGMLAEGMGMVNPAVQAAQQRDAAMQGIDWSNPQSIMQRANQVSDPRVKMQLTQMAQQMDSDRQKQILEGRKVTATENRNTAMENFQMSNLAAQTEMKKAQLEQALQIAEMRSADTRLGIESQAEAKKEANQIRMMIAQMMQESRMAGIDLQRSKLGDKVSDKADKAKDQAFQVDSQLDAIQRNIGKIMTPDGKLTSGIKSYAGQLDQFYPDWAMSNETAAAGSALKSLQEQMTMINLGEAKKAIGQSFGSMQVKEWDKFMNLLTNLSRGTPDKELESNIKFVRDYVTQKRDVIQTALTAGKFGIQPQIPSSASPSNPSTPPGKVVDFGSLR